MLLQKGAAGTVELGFDCGELDKDIGAVLAILDHALYGFEMPDGAGNAVDDFLYFGGVVGV